MNLMFAALGARDRDERRDQKQVQCRRGEQPRACPCPRAQHRRLRQAQQQESVPVDQCAGCGCSWGTPDGVVSVADAHWWSTGDEAKRRAEECDFTAGFQRNSKTPRTASDRARELTRRTRGVQYGERRCPSPSRRLTREPRPTTPSRSRPRHPSCRRKRRENAYFFASAMTSRPWLRQRCRDGVYRFGPGH